MKRGTPDHPKTFELAKLLGIRRPYAVGYLEMLWHFTAKYAPQGDIGRYSDERIEGGCDWGGAKGRLILALTRAGFVQASAEHRLIIHDWHDHADETVRKYLKRSGLQFLSLEGNLSGKSPDVSGPRARASAKPSLAASKPEPAAAAEPVEQLELDSATIEEPPPPQEPPSIQAEPETPQPPSPPVVDIADLAKRKDMANAPRRRTPQRIRAVPDELREFLAGFVSDEALLVKLWTEVRISDPNATATEVCFASWRKITGGGLANARNPPAVLVSSVPHYFESGGSGPVAEYRSGNLPYEWRNFYQPRKAAAV